MTTAASGAKTTLTVNGGSPLQVVSSSLEPAQEMTDVFNTTSDNFQDEIPAKETFTWSAEVIWDGTVYLPNPADPYTILFSAYDRAESVFATCTFTSWITGQSISQDATGTITASISGSAKTRPEWA